MKEIILKILPYYFNFNRIFSYNYCSTFILIGGRGIGKTTGACIKVAKNYIKKDEQFVYVRRYKNEIKKSKTIFSKILLNVKNKGIGSGGFEYIYKGGVFGWAIPLSTAISFKSGINFDRVSTIIFDEAILPRKSPYKYLPDEIHAFFELVSTITRTRKNYKIIIIGNNADIFNIYFDYFKVPTFDGIYVDKERGLYCELSKINPDLLKVEQETPLYKLVNGTPYGEYHYNNKPLTSDEYNIDVKVNTDELLIRLIYNNYTLNVYRHNNYKLFIEFKDKAIKDNISFILYEGNNPNYYYIGLFRKSSIYKWITYAYYNNAVFYDSQKCGEIFKIIMEEI